MCVYIFFINFPFWPCILLSSIIVFVINFPFSPLQWLGSQLVAISHGELRIFWMFRYYKFTFLPCRFWICNCGRFIDIEENQYVYICKLCPLQVESSFAGDFICSQERWGWFSLPAGFVSLVIPFFAVRLMYTSHTEKNLQFS